jgi:phosphate transport system protein
MSRVDFDRHLRALQDDLLVLGSMVEKAIAKALDALKRRDLATSRQVVQEDDAIDQQRYQLEEKCIELIATQQPMARDLRTLITILHVAVELERMGDYAEGIGKISLMMGDEPPLKPLIDIPRMAEKATDMLRRSLDALISRDTAAASQVCKDDDEVDALYDQVYRELLTYMLQDPKTIQRATHLLWVAHDLERTADRATNIAELVIYLVTGKMTETNVSRY